MGLSKAETLSWTFNARALRFLLNQEIPSRWQRAAIGRVVHSRVSYAEKFCNPAASECVDKVVWGHAP